MDNKAMALARIKEKLNIDHIEKFTTLFDTTEIISQDAANEFKRRFKGYFSVHIQPELDLLLGIKNPLNP